MDNVAQALAAQVRTKLDAETARLWGIITTPHASTTSGRGLTLDDIREVAGRFQEPRMGMILVDANLPDDVGAKIPRDERIARTLFGDGAEGNEVWGLLQRMRPQDFAVVIPLRWEVEMICAAPSPWIPSDAVSFKSIMGAPVYHVRSPRSTPWRRMLLSNEIDRWLADEWTRWTGEVKHGD